MLRKLNLMPTLLVLITFTIAACSGGGGGSTAEEQASDNLTASAGLTAPVVEQTASSETTDPKSAVSKKLEADSLQNSPGTPSPAPPVCPKVKTDAEKSITNHNRNHQP